MARIYCLFDSAREFPSPKRATEMWVLLLFTLQIYWYVIPVRRMRTLVESRQLVKCYTSSSGMNRIPVENREFKDREELGVIPKVVYLV